MTDSRFYSEYLYKLPAAGMLEFTQVMDTLPNSDWLKFASRVIHDQTELRLVEKSSRRTDTLMHKWEVKNGTVGDLLDLLQDLGLLRQRDIILKWGRISQPSSPRSSNIQPHPTPIRNNKPYSSLFTPVKDVTQMLPCHENRPLPKPEPPPPDLESVRLCTQSIITKEKHSCECHELGPSLFPSAMCWPFEEVQQGTDDFSVVRLIGEGGFGHVYRASMRNTAFGVKRLKEDSHMGWSVVKESFRTEVERLSQYRHQNIMELAGYSVGSGTYCLIYVYMPNGSLEDRMHCENSTALSWAQRVNVLLGTAKAIQYLHSCSPALIHGDVKSSNILLGEHLEAKLGDFGLARLCRKPCSAPGKTSSVAQTATVRGTLAYLPEEYLKDGQLGVEIDVYSFGVVLLEVLTGRRALETHSNSKNVYLKDLVSEAEDDGKCSIKAMRSRELSLSSAAENIWKKHLDPRLVMEGTSSPCGSREISQLACRCLDRRRKKRPPMTEVFRTLEEVYSGLVTSGRSGVVKKSPAPQCLSTPKPLCTDICSLDSLAHQFSTLGPQEDTYTCPHKNHSLPFPPTVTHTESPKSERREGSWDTWQSSFRAPCESDESQGFSQYLKSPCAAERSKSQPSGESSFQITQPSKFSSVTPFPSTCNSDGRVVVNPVRQHFVEKMALYEEGRILTSDLFSSAAPSYGIIDFQTREPEESDEFASNEG